MNILSKFDEPDEDFDPHGERPLIANLDIRYFTDPNLCPRMVRNKSRRAFELFLLVALTGDKKLGEPYSHLELCGACGLNPRELTSGSTISRLLRTLSDDYGVIDYKSARGRRPTLSLRALGKVVPAKGYVQLPHLWGVEERRLFGGLGPHRFAAEYMYFISAFEASWAQKFRRSDYWFCPAERMTTLFHISEAFAGKGLRALVRIGTLRVIPGQYRGSSKKDHFGRANRYYFYGLAGAESLIEGQANLRERFPQEFPLAFELAGHLINGPSLKNLFHLCDLIRIAGQEKVIAAVGQLKRYPPYSLRRRAAYIRSAVAADDEASG